MCSSLNCKKIYFLFQVCWIAKMWRHYAFVMVSCFNWVIFRVLVSMKVLVELWTLMSNFWMNENYQTRPLTHDCLCLLEIVLIESDLTQLGKHQLKTYCYIVSKLHCLEKFIWNNGDLELLSLIFVTKLYSYSSRSLAVEGNNGLLPSQLGSLQHR